jgi:hypothetical protein
MHLQVRVFAKIRPVNVVDSRGLGVVFLCVVMEEIIPEDVPENAKWLNLVTEDINSTIA